MDVAKQPATPRLFFCALADVGVRAFIRGGLHIGKDVIVNTIIG
jgi:hypothetical protein